LQHRLQRKSFADIAKELGISVASAHRYCEKALSDLVPTETRQAVLQQELAGLDVMEAAIWPQAAAGDLDAIDTSLKIKRARGRYLSLHAPEGSAVTINNALIGGDGKPALTNVRVTFVDPVSGHIVDELDEPPPPPPPLGLEYRPARPAHHDDRTIEAEVIPPTPATAITVRRAAAPAAAATTASTQSVGHAQIVHARGISTRRENGVRRSRLCRSQ
jgi:hypothetical protein